MRPVVSIGNQDFKSIRENHCFYIDKTEFISEWWENRDTVTLLTRPRRFGKTLNMSMLEQFFSGQYAGGGSIFEGLKIWKKPEYRKLQGTYPVIFLSFAAIKGETYEAARTGMIQLLVNLYGKFSFLEKSEIMSEKDLEYFRSVGLQMSDTTAAFAIHYLSEYLSRYYGKKVLIFLDEYDTPLQEAYINGYWDKMTGFIRSFFNATFKTNPYMERGLLTGITRVSKESIFSDLNNLEVVTTTSGKYETAFGFTETEVRDALESFGLSEQMNKVKRWYDGFRFGSRQDIYNPWSITKFLDSGKFDSYWANTSSNSLVGKLIREGMPDVKMAMEDLLKGKNIETSIDEEIVFNQLDDNCSAIWSLFLASGYLKVEKIPEDGIGGKYSFSLTNYEVEMMFRRMIQDWFRKPSVRYNDFIKALFVDNIEYMNRYMNQMTTSVFSYFDTGKQPSDEEPERFYHGFVLGLIADSGMDYTITSNRESGFGRYDVMLEPKDRTQKAYIFEFKVRNAHSEKSLQDTVQSALAQIVEKNYDADFLTRGILKEQIRHYGFAFEGKKVLIGGDASV